MDSTLFCLFEGAKIEQGLTEKELAVQLENEKGVLLPKNKVLTKQFIQAVRYGKISAPKKSSFLADLATQNKIDVYAAYAILLWEFDSIETISEKFGFSPSNFPNAEYVCALLVEFCPKSDFGERQKKTVDNGTSTLEAFKKLAISHVSKPLSLKREVDQGSDEQKLGAHLKACLDFVKVRARLCKALAILRTGWPLGAVHIVESKVVCALK